MTTTQRKDSVHSQDELEPDQPIYDVAIIGAGPCGLGLAARLREKHPSALFTDVEQARYHWINRNGHKTTVRGWKRGRWNGRTTPPKSNPDKANGEPSILVLDSAGSTWMSKWHALFEKLKIEHLRSPMFFHPDPSDRDSLLAFVHGQGGLGDEKCAAEICGCVGAELSKHQRKKRTGQRRKGEGSTPAVTTVDERDRKDYFAPASTCFREFCEACVERYGLDQPGLIRQDTLTNLTYGPVDLHPEEKDLFTLSTCNGETYLARTVVLAIGAGKPVIPAPFSHLQQEFRGDLPAATHALAPATAPLLTPSLATKIRSRQSTTALIIGGGLTSAQVADNLLRAGVDKVYLLMRGGLKIKPFDVDLSWMSKFQNQRKAEFWTADSFEERLGMVLEARNGGSIPSRYVKRLKFWEGKGGAERLKLCLYTQVKQAEFCKESGKWRIQTEPEVDGMPEIEHVYFATGAQGGVQDLPFLSPLLERYPIESVKGLPVLTDDLQWRKDVPLFVTGRMASLQLGPGAGNLEGARLGAERVVWAVEEFLGERDGVAVEERERLEGEFVAGVGSKYRMLEVE
ncbi:hypothetical protein EJ03DRAFT_390980 [Teratosphaeria nubilosa]|uniref:L-ornithine N(5)-monooxygenase [NAD(P)H] n=1 Tax=Teratosphaeria nubilosa TaxID=161662 RepID=A0A6G1L0K0_9PEZI|nr:hypothetical protein EJ03DRAFT_390980 [Teratosphaeria nubilosa]